MLSIVIKKIDFFGQTPSPYTRRQNHYQTVIGGIMSTILMGVTIGLIVFYGKELLQKKKPTLMTALRPIGTTEIEFNTSNMFMGFILYSRDKIPITFEKKWFTYYFRGVQKEGLFEVNNSINITGIPKPDIDLCDFKENQHYEECQNHVNSNNDLFIDEPNVLKAINCTSEMLKDYEGL